MFNRPLFGSSGFGSAGATSTPFGTRPAAPATNAFGASTAAAGSNLFGTGNTGNLFSGPTAFAQPATSTVGGGLFGAQPQARPLFGATAQAQPSLFGATSTGFGSTAGSTGLFQPQPATQSGLGMGGMFGQPAGASGGASSIFGSQAVANQENRGTAVAKYSPPISQDTMMRNNTATSIQTKHQCVTAMKEYENFSLEELRVADYMVGRKGPQPGVGFGATGGVGTFGNATTQTAASGLFGTSLATTSTPSLFGGVAGSSGLFGTTNTSAQPSLFGATQQRPLFGANAVSTAAPSLFGATNTAAPTFGQSNLFGQPTQGTNLFGATSAAPPFGAQPQTQTTSLFGTGAFGHTAQPGTSMLNQPRPAFGTVTPATSTNPFTFGGGTAAGTTGLFSGGSAATGSFFKPTTTATSLFGGLNQQQPAQTSVFGTPAFGVPAASTGLFGNMATQQQQQRPALFGTSGGFPAFGQMPNQQLGLNTVAPGTGGLFGTGGTTPAFGSGLFGNTAAKPQQSTLFSNPALGGGSGGFNFMGNQGATYQQPYQGAPAGVLGSETLSAAAQQALVQQQLSSLVNSPYGDPLALKGVPKVSRSAQLQPFDWKLQRQSIAAAEQSGGMTSDARHLHSLAKPLPRVSPRIFTTLNRTLPNRSSLFDDQEEEDLMIKDGFIPRKNVKKLNIQPKIKPDSSFDQSSPLPGKGREDSDRIARSQSKGPMLRLSSQEQLLTDPLETPYTVRQKNKAVVVVSSAGKPTDVSSVEEEENSTRDKPVNRRVSFGGKYPEAASTSASENGGSPRVRSRIADLELEGGDDDADLPEIRGPEAPGHPAGVILTRPEYYTIPSMDELAEMFNERTGACICEDGFTVGREGYGYVYWPGVIDVANLNLDKIVFFRLKEVVVYPDNEHKPPEGYELNKPAEITLVKVWPNDKSTGKPITDPQRLASLKYRGKLESTAAKMGAAFKDYRPRNGEWVFTVPHFTKYGIAEEEDDDDEPAKLRRIPVETSRDSIQHLVQRQRSPVKIVDEGEMTTRTSTKTHISYEKRVLPDSLDMEAPPRGFGDKASGYREGLGGMATPDDLELMADFDSDGCRKSPKRNFDTAMGMDFLPIVPETSHLDRIEAMKDSFFKTDDKSHPVRDETYCVSSESPKVVHPILPTELHDVPKRTATVRDIYLRSGALLDLTKNTSAGEYPSSRSGRFQHSPAPETSFSTLSNLRPTSISFSTSHTASPSHRIIKFPHNIFASDSFWMKNKENFRKFFLDESVASEGGMRIGWGPGRSSATLRGKVAERGKDHRTTVADILVESHAGTSSYADKYLDAMFYVHMQHSTRSGSGVQHYKLRNEPTIVTAFESVSNDNNMDYYSEIWSLFRILFCPLSEEMQSFVNHSRDSIYAGEMARKLKLSNWLRFVCKPLVEADLKALEIKSVYLKKADLQAIWLRLLCNDLASAASYAVACQRPRLALMLTSANSRVSRSQFAKQLKQWIDAGADVHIERTLIKIFILLSGAVRMQLSDNSWVEVCEQLDWKRKFGLHLWYVCPQNSSINDVLSSYCNSVESELLGLSSETEYLGSKTSVVESDSCRTYSLPRYMEFEAEYCNNFNEDLRPIGRCTQVSHHGRLQQGVDDIGFLMIKLYCNKVASLASLVLPETYSDDCLNYHLCWHIYSVLLASGFPRMERENAIHSAYSAQLALSGNYAWALFVLMHVDGEACREKQIQVFLEKNVSHFTEAQENFVLKSLVLPSQLLSQSKALVARYEGRVADEVGHCLEAGQWNLAHVLFLERMAPSLVIDDMTEDLTKLLSQMDAHRDSITGWSFGGQVYQQYCDMKRALAEIETGEGVNVQSVTSIAASVLDRLSDLKCQTALHKLCRSEIGMLAATVLGQLNPQMGEVGAKLKQLSVSSEYYHFARVNGRNGI